MSPPEMQRAARQGDPNCNYPISTVDNNELGPNLQARRLISRFGFAYETAVAISALAFAMAR
jgi:hypothetical protein